MWTWFHKLGSPPHFYRIAGKLAPWFGALALIALVVGTFKGLVLAPADYQQGDGFRIIYVHVPSAYLSLMAYVVMATGAAIGLIWRMKLAHAVAAACAPIGASFTFLALATGSIWGRPMWGTWWVWDGRITSMLILLFLYLGVMALYDGFDNKEAAGKACAVLTLVGTVNIPIIYKSVDWWYSLHQPASIKFTGGSTMDASMLYPLLWMIVTFYALFAACLLRNIRAELLARESSTRWVHRVAQEAAG